MRYEEGQRFYYLCPSSYADFSCMADTNPNSVKELVDRLVSLERQNEILAKKNAVLLERHNQMKGIAASLLSRSTRQNTFTNVQVREWGHQILGVLNSEKRPKDFRK